MNKLPNIFHNTINRNISNNKEYVYVKNNFSSEKNIKPLEVIDSLMSEEGFIFNKPLIIKTKDRNFDTAIVEKEGNFIYTLSDDIIDVSDIISIKRKS